MYWTLSACTMALGIAAASTAFITSATAAQTTPPMWDGIVTPTAGCNFSDFASFGGTAFAQQSWVGVIDSTKTTSNGGCGDYLGDKHVIHYRPFLTTGDGPSAIVIGLGGVTFYVENKDPTSQFQGSGSTLTTAIATDNPFKLFTRLKGTYNMTLDPATVSAETSTIQITNGTLTLTVPNLGKCTFKFRGILTPAPVQN